MATEVKTTTGVVRGREPDQHEQAHTFLGVPFAAPPFGAGRLGAPRAAEVWDGVRVCDTYGATAPQPEQGFTIVPEPIIAGDDCLNANVFTPDPSAAAALPVLVWIHGGGFVNGCNASPWYDGRSFARDGVVVVAVNYRLGIEGFLPLPDAPANRAMLDWIAALEWVQDNIAAFGGDPGDVTVGGQSAGAGACAALLAAPRAEGLFRRAILMSGAGNHLRTVEEARPFAERVATALGVPATRDAFSALAPGRLVEVQMQMGWLGESAGDENDPVKRLAAMATGGLRYGPLVDGDVLPEAPLDALAHRNRDVEVLVGTTAEETSLVSRFAADLSEDQLHAALVAAEVSDADARSYRAAYSSESPSEVLGHAMTDAMFRVPAVRVAEARAGTRTFAYEFQWVPPSGFGSVHCLDIPFAWDVLDAPAVEVVAGEDPPGALATDVHRAWLRFIETGDPGWPAYDTDTRPVMAFDVPQSHVVADPHAVARERFTGRRS